MDTHPNSPEARDKAFTMHAYTNARRHEEVGPLVIERGEGIYVDDVDRQALYRGDGRPVERRRWASARKRLVDAAAQQMAKLPFYHNFTHKSHAPAIDLAEKLVGDGARADEQGVLHQFRLGGQRHRHEDDVVSLQCARPAAAQEDHLPAIAPITA